jgi:hypothetical protein
MVFIESNSQFVELYMVYTTTCVALFHSFDEEWFQAAKGALARNNFRMCFLEPDEKLCLQHINHTL